MLLEILIHLVYFTTPGIRVVVIFMVLQENIAVQHWYNYVHKCYHRIPKILSSYPNCTLIEQVNHTSI